MHPLPKPILLVVDDQPINIQTLYQVFKDGHEVFMATSGEQALKFCADTLPDLILLDLNMPRMDGRQFLKKIKLDAVLHSLPVVVLTTSDAERDLLDSYQHFAAGFIVKPVDVEDFIRLAGGIGDYWTNIVRLPDHK